VYFTRFPSLIYSMLKSRRPTYLSRFWRQVTTRELTALRSLLTPCTGSKCVYLSCYRILLNDFCASEADGPRYHPYIMIIGYQGSCTSGACCYRCETHSREGQAGASSFNQGAQAQRNRTTKKPKRAQETEGKQTQITPTAFEWRANHSQVSRQPDRPTQS
jgi:hypothetical protein